jgi:hypothetical protein
MNFLGRQRMLSATTKPVKIVVEDNNLARSLPTPADEPDSGKEI